MNEFSGISVLSNLRDLLGRDKNVNVFFSLSQINQLQCHNDTQWSLTYLQRPGSYGFMSF